MIAVNIKRIAGAFAENKDLAREIRMHQLVPQIEKEKGVILDFAGVDAVTQSFIHALISELIRAYGPEVLEKIAFKNCNETVKKIITIVTDYMQEASED